MGKRKINGRKENMNGTHWVKTKKKLWKNIYVALSGTGKREKNIIIKNKPSKCLLTV